MEISSTKSQFLSMENISNITQTEWRSKWQARRSNKFTDNLQGRLYKDASLGGATRQKLSKEKENRRRQALRKKDQTVHELENCAEQLHEQIERMQQRAKLREKRASKRKKKHVEYCAARTIQRIARGTLARWAVEDFHYQQLEDASAFTIQIAWIKHKQRRRKWAYIVIAHFFMHCIDRRRFQKAAEVIQRNFRLCLASRQRLHFISAATKLQAAVRTTLALKHFQKLKLAQASTQFAMNLSRTTIQNAVNQIMEKENMASSKKVSSLAFSPPSSPQVQQRYKGITLPENTLSLQNSGTRSSRLRPVPALKLAGMLSATGEKIVGYHEEFITNAGEFSKSWREALEAEEARTKQPSNRSSENSVVGTVRRLRKQRIKRKNDERKEQKQVAMARVAELEARRMAKLRKQIAKGEEARQKSKQEREEQEAFLMKKREEEKMEREARFKESMSKLRAKLRKQVEIENAHKRRARKKELQAKITEEKMMKERAEKRRRREEKRREWIRKKAKEKNEIERQRALEQEKIRLEQQLEKEERQRRQREVEHKLRVKRLEAMRVVEAHRKELQAASDRESKLRSELRTAELEKKAKAAQKAVRERLSKRRREALAQQKKLDEETNAAAKRLARISTEARERMQSTSHRYRPQKLTRTSKLNRRNRKQKKHRSRFSALKISSVYDEIAPRLSSSAPTSSLAKLDAPALRLAPTLVSATFGKESLGDLDSSTDSSDNDKSEDVIEALPVRKRGESVEAYVERASKFLEDEAMQELIS